MPLSTYQVALFVSNGIEPVRAVLPAMICQFVPSKNISSHALGITSPTVTGVPSGNITGQKGLPLTDMTVPPGTEANPGLNHRAVPAGGGIVGKVVIAALHW